jgi:23S rRNA pseudouridine2605 synthase
MKRQRSQGENRTRPGKRTTVSKQRKIGAQRKKPSVRPRQVSLTKQSNSADQSPANSADRTNSHSGERLQKVLSAAGIASRRECESLILEGRVEVDGEAVTTLGTRVDRSRQEIRVDGESLARPKLVTYAVHKPSGIVSTARDPAGRPRVIDMIPKDVGRVYNVGRLDIHSEGLILVTNDGELANRLTHPRYGVEKTYEIHVAGRPDQEVLQQIRQGVYLAEGLTRIVSVRFKSHRKKSSILEMVLKEGRNREIRRIFARVGHKVQRLIRIAIGPIRLGEMPLGTIRKLTHQEIAKLRQISDIGGQSQKDRQKNRSRPPRLGR